MDQGVWSELPAALLEQVLSFLPVPVLCRFRIVSKRWNNLICSPEFGELCMLSASRCANEGACLVVKLPSRWSEACWRELPCWSILDLIERRWYDLNLELPKGCDDVAPLDGGLLCTFAGPHVEERRQESFPFNGRRGPRSVPNSIPNPMTDEDQMYPVFSLFGGASTVRLPNPPLVDPHLLNLRMELIVENMSDTFKVFLMSRDFQRNSNPCVCVYESSTDQWKNLPNPPGSVSNPEWTWKWSFGARYAIFQGQLYVLYESEREVIMFLRFNFTEESWEDTGLQFTHDNLESSLELYDLVVSDNRLFSIHQLVGRKGAPQDPRLLPPGQFCVDWEPPRNKRSVNISEILIADKECRTVDQMKDTQLVKILDSYEVHAFGFNKSILLMSPETGKVLLYNLATGQWESLPQFSASGRAFGANPSKFLGSLRRRGTPVNSLRLPSTPQAVRAHFGFCRLG